MFEKSLFLFHVDDGKKYAIDTYNVLYYISKTENTVNVQCPLGG